MKKNICKKRDRLLAKNNLSIT